ncbi:MAG TPA: glycosyltransferase [Patescibacteria group bacterium]|nr:glycosyltransferase [Patescibacteria group bacterium]
MLVEQDNLVLPLSYQRLLFLQQDALATDIIEILSPCQRRGLLLFGAGSVGLFLYQFFSSFRIDGKALAICGFLDNNQQRWGTELAGRPVLSPDCLADSQFENTYVLIATEYVASMAGQLNGYSMIPRRDYGNGYQLYKHLRDLIWIYAGEDRESVPDELLQDLQWATANRYIPCVSDTSDNSALLSAAVDYHQWQRWHRVSIREKQAMAQSVLMQRCMDNTVFSIVIAIGVDQRAEMELVARRFRGEQLYPWWRLFFVVDGVADRIRFFSTDERIRLLNTEELGWMCRDAKKGYFLGLHFADRLAPEALWVLARYAETADYPTVIYSDEDRLDEVGNRIEPFFKPDWSPHTVQSYDYIGWRGVCVQANWLATEGTKWQRAVLGQELGFAAYLRTERVGHISRVLVHKGTDTGLPVPAMGNGKHYRLQGKPLISILIPARDRADYLASCLESIFTLSSYQHFEVLVIDNESREQKTLELLTRWQAEEPERLRVVRVAEPFNYARLNNLGVTEARGELILLLNNDTRVITPEWLQDMAGYAIQQDIGAVGAMLLYEDGTVQHAGVIIGVGAVADHAFRGFAADVSGYFGRLQTVTNYSAVTGACLMVSKERYLAVAGMDEQLAISYNDVDFCLKLRDLGLYNVVLPFVRLYHYESKSRGPNDTSEKLAQARQEERLMHERWDRTLREDPFYSPHLTREKTDFSLRLPDLRECWKE